MPRFLTESYQTRRGDVSLKYSICITHFNDVLTVETSLNDVLKQIPVDCEIVVVDQKSTDGSMRILERYRNAGLIKLYSQPVRNIGLGRQLAFEKSTGEYVIAGFGMDDSFNPVLPELLQLYHEKCEGLLLRCPGADIAPRQLIKEIGGWRDLHYYEDLDLWCRALIANKYAWTIYPLRRGAYSHPERKSFYNRIGYWIMRNRESMRIGKFDRNRLRNLNALPIIALSWIESTLMASYKGDRGYLSETEALKYFVDFGFGATEEEYPNPAPKC